MADFTTLPDYVFEEEPKFNTLISKFENGFEQRRSKWSASLRRWRLVYKNRTNADFTTFRDFLLNKKGAFSSFTWDNPNDSVTYNVRYETDTINFRRKDFGIYDFDFVFLEVRA